MYIQNPMTVIDFYKSSHVAQYPAGSEYVYSNFTPRSGKWATTPMDYVIWMGGTMFIKKFLIETFAEGFFKQKKSKAVGYYKRRIDNAIGCDTDVSHIEALHDLGYLPLEIRSLPEGSAVGFKIPVLTMVNTLPGFAWLGNSLETALSAEMWKPCTVATIAFAYRMLCEKFAAETGVSNQWAIPGVVRAVELQCHDFSARGLDGIEAYSQVGHLAAFKGTDTAVAIDLAEHYLNADSDNEIVGLSVPATEHSVMCMGSEEGELETFRRLIEDIYPNGVVSIVSDTWDFWKVLTEMLPKLKDKIMARAGKVVIRPDSGDPVDIICGTAVDLTELCNNKPRCATIKDIVAEYALEMFELDGLCEGLEVDFCFNIGDSYFHAEGEWYLAGSAHDSYYELEYFKMVPVEATPEMKGAVECLWETFGGTITDTNHKLLDSHIGLIYGDSITLERAGTIMRKLADKGFASTNVVLGIGSFTYQYITRDTYGFAMKATWGQVNGEGRELFKDPKTDSGIKKSAKGLLQVHKENGSYVLKDQCDSWEGGELEVIYRDGKLIKDSTLSEIRSNLEAELKKAIA